MESTPSFSAPPSPPSMAPIPEMTVEQLVNEIHKTNQMLVQENQQLHAEYEDLEAFVTHQKAIIDWQQRFISLGEQHIKLLESIPMQAPEVLQPAPLPVGSVATEFRPQMCSSPLSTPPSLSLDIQQPTYETAQETRDSSEADRGGSDTNEYHMVVDDQAELNNLYLLTQYG
ncbi:hypothetical protein FOTG_17563 [Fusarium oxysporum f. sp. vasinfectum 25433]|uniref:Uncharacterized protein n=2 Tax=Fusarium oxysporum f. sp. vasinfectum 25433 TaxID=1089449 RepID=X0KYX3_FUSOX|nr:hypothetical protein FOTG_17563 [Fusarium oxysporum f. sp. vasinfectum 25433]